MAAQIMGQIVARSDQCAKEFVDAMGYVGGKDGSTFIQTFVNHIMEMHRHHLGALGLASLVKIVTITLAKGVETPEQRYQIVMEDVKLFDKLTSYLEQYVQLSPSPNGGVIVDPNDDSSTEDFICTLYIHVCEAIIVSLSKLIPRSVVTPALIQSLYGGILAFPNHDRAQAIGKHVLEQLVGKESARAMIDHANIHHCSETGCSRCA